MIVDINASKIKSDKRLSKLFINANFNKFIYKFYTGAPEKSRTPNLMIRSHTLYPIELQALLIFQPFINLLLNIQCSW